MKQINFSLGALLFCLLIGCSGNIEEPTVSRSDKETVQTSAYPDIPMKTGNLSGLYKSAGEKRPVVLIIPGSGPTDLNGNNTMGIKSDVYKQLAESLAERGVSSVRVDKRGMFSSAAAGNPNDVTVDIYAQDYSNWVHEIRSSTDGSCIYILGHSEGALMGSAAAVLNSDVCGLILVAGVGRSFGDVLREQLKSNPANIFIQKEAFAAIEKLEAGEMVETEDMHIALKPLFYEDVQGFLISIMGVDPASIGKTANKRTLVIQGETDLQVSVSDAEILAGATGGKLVLIPGVNHILKEAPMNRRKNLKTYKNPDLPISTDVVNAIVDFVEL